MNTVTAPYSKIALWIYVLTPMLVVGITETVKTRLIWRIRVVDFADLVITAPFLMVMLLYFNQQVFWGQKERKLYYVSLGLTVIALYGHSMHLTANTINTYSTEINQYKELIPPDTYELIYFFDENLGHWLLYTGLIGSLGLWLIADKRYQPASWQDYAIGGLLGASYAIAIIESSHAWFGFASTLWLCLCAIYRSRCEKETLRNAIRKNLSQLLWYRIGITTAITLVIGEIVYFLIFGGFIQPSQMGL